MGRWWQCRQGVGITRRPDCTPPPAPPEQGEAAPVSRATKGWIAWERTWAKPQICASTFARHDWTRWGTEGGFWGCQCSQGQAQHTVPALILMGDWCALSRNHTTRTSARAVAGRAE